MVAAAPALVVMSLIAVAALGAVVITNSDLFKSQSVVALENTTATVKDVATGIIDTVENSDGSDNSGRAGEPDESNGSNGGTGDSGKAAPPGTNNQDGSKDADTDGD